MFLNDNFTNNRKVQGGYPKKRKRKLLQITANFINNKYHFAYTYLQSAIMVSEGPLC